MVARGRDRREPSAVGPGHRRAVVPGRRVADGVVADRASVVGRQQVLPCRVAVGVCVGPAAGRFRLAEQVPRAVVAVAEGAAAAGDLGDQIRAGIAVAERGRARRRDGAEVAVGIVGIALRAVHGETGVGEIRGVRVVAEQERELFCPFQVSQQPDDGCLAAYARGQIQSDIYTPDGKADTAADGNYKK